VELKRASYICQNELEETKTLSVLTEWAMATALSISPQLVLFSLLRQTKPLPGAGLKVYRM
jgi:hypothetical protein